MTIGLSRARSASPWWVVARSLAAVTVALFVMCGLAATGQASPIRRGPAMCGSIAFTFDMCPVREGSGFDRPLVQFLIDHRIPATLFLSGDWMATHDADVRELLAVPFFEIGTHGEQHLSLPKLTPAAQQREIMGPVERLAQEYHRQAILFRPPYGTFTPAAVALAESDGLKVVLWSVVSGDPDPKLAASAIIRDVEWRVHPGSILIFHANGRGWHTDEVIPAVYQRLVVRRHLKPVTVSALVGCGR